MKVSQNCQCYRIYSRAYKFVIVFQVAVEGFDDGISYLFREVLVVRI
jgi:hypothetical protein